MTERDYEELVSYIIKVLQSIEASSVIQQIKELESMKLIENDKPKKRKRTDETIYEILVDKSDMPKSHYIESNQISNSVFRPMTNKEIYNATIDIIENYLIKIPIMVSKITKLVEKDANSVYWSVEGSKRFNVEGEETNLASIEVLSANDVEELRRVIEKLKLYGRE